MILRASENLVDLRIKQQSFEVRRQPSKSRLSVPDGPARTMADQRALLDQGTEVRFQRVQDCFGFRTMARVDGPLILLHSRGLTASSDGAASDNRLLR